MGALPVSAWALVFALGAPPDPFTPAGPARPRPGGELAAEDARYLDWLVEDFLFDPRHAVYVRVATPGSPDRLAWESPAVARLVRDTRDGWLVRGTGGAPDRIHFLDGESIPVPATGVRQLDFEVHCAARYRRGSGGPWDLRLEYLDAAPRPDDPDLVLAAWLHRRGYDGLAALALAEARDGTREDPRAGLRAFLARQGNDAMVNAFARRADEEGLAHAARLFALYPDQAARFPQAAAIAADVRRRRLAGIGSRVPPAGPPAEFARWDTPTKVAFLIASLDEVTGSDVNRFGFDFVSGLPDDWRVAALMEVGDPAVPALIDALERDTRLTRGRPRMALMCSFGRGREVPIEQVHPVHDVIQRALEGILRVRDFNPTGTPGAADDDSPRATADRLRRYWDRFGGMPFPDRMMALLTDPATRPQAGREAAERLVEEFMPSRSWSRVDRRGRDVPTRPTALVARYSDPTVAEAILAAMDRAGQGRPGGEAAWLITGCRRALIELGDPRAGPEVARRAAAATDPMERAELAWAAHTLGVSGPLVSLARELAAGAIRRPVPTDGPPDPRAAQLELDKVIDTLIDCGVPEADEALYAVADAGHPYFAVAARGLLALNERGGGTVSAQHPFGLAVLRTLLADRRPTGVHCYRRGAEVEDRVDGQPRRWTPAGGADPARWLEHVERRVADDAADQLAQLTVGLPAYHPLRRDADQVLAETRGVLTRFGRNYRQLTWEEQARWNRRDRNVTYVPDIKPLGRPSTAADVRAGRAVFELGGSSRVAKEKLPAWVAVKADAGKSDPAWGLVVQAEVGADGKLVYGVIFRHAIRAVKADEVGRVEPYGSEYPDGTSVLTLMRGGTVFDW